MANPYLFIIGCPRSGTTLLQRVVDAHPNVAILPEAHWIYQVLMDPSVVIENGTVSPGLISALLQHPKFARLDITEEQLQRLIGEQPGLSYSSFVSRIFDLYGQRQGKEIVGNKHQAWSEGWMFFTHCGRKLALCISFATAAMFTCP